MEVYLLQQGWARLVEMREIKSKSKMGTAFVKNLDMNNLQWNLQKQHRAPFFILSGAIFAACWAPFLRKQKT